MIAIIDYGLGNVQAFVNIYDRLNIDIAVVSKKEELKDYDRFILPGVGSFDAAMNLLNESGMRDELDRLVLEEKKKVIGVCVGMQMMAKGSDEGEVPGLGWIDAQVKKFDIETFQTNTHLPHMGWNTVESTANSPLFNNFDEDLKFYFLHSYLIQPEKMEDSIAMADYNGRFTCAVNHENVFGVQFHPEKKPPLWNSIIEELFPTLNKDVTT